MAITKNSQIDLNGNEMILDADGDTTITADTDDQIDIKIGGTDTVTISGGAMALKGATPTFTMGDGGAEDTKIIFDGNTVDYYIGLDDSQDDLVIGKGATLGTDPAIQVNADERVGLGGAPVTQLHVMGGNGVIFDNPNNGYSGLKITDDTSGDYNINFLAGRSQGTTKFKFFRYGRDQNTTPWSDYSSPVEIGHISGNQTAFTGKVGAGTLVPDKALTVADNGSDCSIMLYKSPDGSLNSDQKVIAMGTGSSASNSGTSGGTEHGILQMYHNGTEEIRLYTQSNSWVTNNFAIGVAGSSTKFYVQGDTASSYLAIFYHDGNDNNRYGMRIVTGSDTATDGQIWIRFDDGDGHAQGYIQHSSGTVLVGQSDERLKENIIDSPLEGINTLKQIQQRQFNWKKDVNKTKTIGYIAQELETVYPAAVTTISDDSGEGVVAPDDDPDNPYKFVAKERLIDVLIKATQEQQEQIESLQQEIEVLKNG